MILKTKNLNLFYGSTKAINNCNINIEKNKVTAIIGPSGCGKSTLLRSMNRMNDFIDSFSIKGEILFDEKNIYDSKIDATELRKSIGMVFQKPNPFPKSIYENIIWGPKINGFEGDKDKLVEESLKDAGLWDEVKNRLNDSALSLSGGQQQRLCIARAIAMKPNIILMDEPCSALDPKSTAIIETLIKKLRKNYTILIVTHNMQQAARVSDFTLFLYEGEVIEFGDTEHLFRNPKNKQTEDYITGRFG
ncbi:MAG: phosphate ABC transporter ATP-binding protein [Euryarchaeota archaeon]|jgi:phosphate transport system ATP-binding protein|nr:phosphate ABC transporter ATP-binding protein [Euryarchaeota archaeon]|tara:strand:- start:953 stop:1696 length:744 start_codon:yes stop_codon:yes gene_type:complete